MLISTIVVPVTFVTFLEVRQVYIDLFINYCSQIVEFSLVIERGQPVQKICFVLRLNAVLSQCGPTRSHCRFPRNKNLAAVEALPVFLFGFELAIGLAS